MKERRKKGNPPKSSLQIEEDHKIIMRNGSDNAKLEKLQLELKKAKTQKAKLLARNKISALKSRIKKRECKEYMY